MSQAVCFHHIHGCNVTLDGNRTVARWHSVSSGGTVFSENPLSPGQNLTVNAEGSGRLEVGFTTANPAQFKNNVPDPISKMSSYETMNEIRFHKRACSLLISLQTPELKITSSVRGVKYSKVLEKNSSVWIAIYVLFGNVKITINTDDSRRLQFSKIHGLNIHLENDQREACMVDPNPAAICAVDQPIYVGDKLLLRSEPLTDDNRTVSTYSVKIMVSQRNPAQTQAECIDGFEVTDTHSTSPSLNVLETLRKRDCHGEIQISLQSDRMIEYRMANNKVNSQSLGFIAESGVWVYLELYRVNVQCTAFIKDTANQMNAYVAQPRAELQNSRRFLDSCSSDRSDQYIDVRCGTGSMRPTFKDESPYVRCISESPRSGATSPCRFESDYYLEVIAKERGTTLCSSCPAGLNTMSSDESRDMIMKKLTSLESKVDSLGRHLHLVALSPKETNFGSCNKSLPGIPNVAAPPTSGPNDTSTGTDLVDLRDAIKRNWVELLNVMQTDCMCDYLYQYEILSQTEYDRILQKMKTDQQEANRMLLNVLSKKKISRRLLTKTLMNTGDGHLIQLFLP